jgi:hypothetical protein
MVTVEKILSHTVQVGGCLEWTRCFNSDGYPRMGWKGKGNGKVHRILMELLGHDIVGKVVRHTCDNPKCINPEHLVLGINADNVKDMDERGRRYKLMTKEQVACVKYLATTFPELTQREIGTAVGLDARRVSDILLNKRDQDGRVVKRDR